MKLLKLVIVDLLSFAREKSVVFILLVIGLIMSSFSTIYYFSVRKTINETWGDGSIKYSSVSFEFPQDINSGALTSFVNVLEGIENMPYNEYKLFLLDTNSYNSMDDKFLKSSRTLPTEYKTNPDFKYTYPRGVIGMMDSKGLVTEWPIMEGRGLTKEDSAGNVALADMDCNIGDKLSFYDQEFEVVGLMQKNFNRMFPLYIIIRGEYYLSSNIPCRYINIRFEKVPTKQLVDALCAEVKKLNLDVQSYLPEELPETTVLNEANEFIKTISIIIISLLYIFALFRYWIIDSIKQYAIYSMCGAGRIKIYYIVILNTILLVSINFIIGLTIFYGITSVVDLYKITYLPDILELLLLYCFFLFLAIVGTIPVFLRLRKPDLYTFI